MIFFKREVTRIQRIKLKIQDILQMLQKHFYYFPFKEAKLSLLVVYIREMKIIWAVLC